MVGERSGPVVAHFHDSLSEPVRRFRWQAGIILSRRRRPDHVPRRRARRRSAGGILHSVLRAAGEADGELSESGGIGSVVLPEGAVVVTPMELSFTQRRKER